MRCSNLLYGSIQVFIVAKCNHCVIEKMKTIQRRKFYYGRQVLWSYLCQFTKYICPLEKRETITQRSALSFLVCAIVTQHSVDI